MRNPAPNDLYAVLGLVSDALPEQITRAFRARVREHHPDTRGSKELDPEPSERLQHVLAAYAVLRDPARRDAYDRSRANTAAATASPATSQRAPNTGHGPQPTGKGAFSSIRVGPVRWRPR